MDSASLQSLADLTRRFESEWPGDASAFYRYVSAVRRLVERRMVDVHDAAQAIASTMFMPGLDDDPLREEILIVSGDLETGQPHPKHSWAYLTNLIDELGGKTQHGGSGDDSAAHRRSDRLDINVSEDPILSPSSKADRVSPRHFRP